MESILHACLNSKTKTHVIYMPIYLSIKSVFNWYYANSWTIIEKPPKIPKLIGDVKRKTKSGKFCKTLSICVILLVKK